MSSTITARLLPRGEERQERQEGRKSSMGLSVTLVLRAGRPGLGKATVNIQNVSWSEGLTSASVRAGTDTDEQSEHRLQLLLLLLPRYRVQIITAGIQRSTGGITTSRRVVVVSALDRGSGGYLDTLTDLGTDL